MKLSDTYFFFMVAVTEISAVEELSFFIFWWAKDDSLDDPYVNCPVVPTFLKLLHLHSYKS